MRSDRTAEPTKNDGRTSTTRKKAAASAPRGAGKSDVVTTPGQMIITVENRGLELGERLREHLESAGQLQCTEHGQTVMAVTIYGRENGWVDSRWTTCCEGLEKQAAAIVKARY